MWMSDINHIHFKKLTCPCNVTISSRRVFTRRNSFFFTLVSLEPDNKTQMFMNNPKLPSGNFRVANGHL